MLKAKRRSVKKPSIQETLRVQSEVLNVLALRTVNMAQIPAAWKAVGDLEAMMRTLSDQVHQFYELYTRQNKQMDELIRLMQETVKRTRLPG